MMIISPSRQKSKANSKIYCGNTYRTMELQNCCTFVLYFLLI